MPSTSSTALDTLAIVTIELFGAFEWYVLQCTCFQSEYQRQCQKYYHYIYGFPRHGDLDS